MPIKNPNEKLHNSKDLPKIIDLTKQEGAVEKWKGETMVVAPAMDYNDLIELIPKGKVITIAQLREKIAKNYKVDITCPLTAGIFVNLCALAAVERNDNKFPYWRVLKIGGGLNEKYPGGIEGQKEKLEKEGHKVISKGKNDSKYFVENYEKKVFKL